MLDALTTLHLWFNPILCLPLLQLARPPKAAVPEPAGIRPIKVLVITPRRGLILTLLIGLAFTSFLDATILVVDLLTSPYREVSWENWNLTSWIVYSFGGFLVWSLAAIFSEWRTKWGDGSLALLGALGFIGEVVNLPLLIKREIRYDHIFTILSIIPSALRVFFFIVLVLTVINPRVAFVDAVESSQLLNGNGDASSESSPGRTAYGTFDDTTSQATSLQPGTTANASGTQTPATAGQAKPPAKLVIPKKLGEKKEEDKPLSWKEFYPKLKKLSPHLWPSTSPKLQLYCLVCVSIVLLTRFLNPLVPISLGRVVRALTANQGRIFGPDVWPPFITYFAIRSAVTGGIFDFVRQYLWVSVYQYTDREMMMLCFGHLLNLSLAYHTKRNTGEVMRIIDRGSAINNLFQTLIFTAIPTVIDIVVAFGVLFYLYGSAIALVTLITMTVYLTVSFTMTKSRVRFRRELMERDVKQRGIVNDVLTNWESVKYFTAEQRERDRFREAVVLYQDTEAKWTIMYQLLNLVQTFLLTLGLMVGSLLIALRVIHGQADAAEFVVFLQYFQQLSRPLDNLGSLYRSLNTNTTDAEKMFNLLAQATEVVDHPGAKDLVVTDGVIEFDNVRFSYDSKVQALKGISFKIGKGQSMALVGESGSGKSTILRLLYRFYDIDSGTIYIDGQDISKVTQLSLRRAIGIVPQDSVLWNDTIGANVGYGKEDATDEEIITAARAAKLHDRILSFPEQYSTVVGERGVRLSGGEKQRVSLARMFLKSPAILVLDEATSALDTETEREIQRALADLAKDRSSLSIAHRLSTIINSDQIVVMKDGQVVEHGAYKELLELNGAFATMWKKQIFTEAEMVAQADEVSIGDVVKEKDLIDLEAAPEANVAQDDKSVNGSNSGDKADQSIEPQGVTGFQVETEEQSTPASYADVVKVHSREVTIPEEQEPSSPNTPEKQSHTEQDDPNEDDQESATLLDKGKGKGKAETPSTPAKSTHTAEVKDQVPSPRQPATTPTPTKFPALPRSQSHNSEMTSPSTPTRSSSYPFNLSKSVSNTSSANGNGQGQGISSLVSMSTSPPAFLQRYLPASNSNRPHITLTWAQSRDSKIAGPGGKRVIISGEESMLMTHWMRSMHDAILVGVNTLIMDDPRLQINLLPQVHCGLKPPQPIILDSTLRFPLTSRLLTVWNEFNNTPASERGDKVVRQPWVLCGDQVDKARIAQAEKAGVKVITVPLDDEGRVAPDTIPGVLTRMGLKSVMIEGGSQVLSSFLRSPPRQDGSPMVDSVIVTVGPMLIGEGVGVVPKEDEAALPDLQTIHTEIMGKDQVMVCTVHPKDKGGKTRKRLTSLKKMVRRISDKGTGLVRSNSTGRPGSKGGGLASPSPDAGEGKKRLPLSRGNSSASGPPGPGQ